MIASTCRPTNQRTAQDKRLVANAGDSDQEMLQRQKLCIAYNHPLRVAELPRSCAGIGHRIPPTINPRTIMIERRDVGNRRSRHQQWRPHRAPDPLIVADEVIESELMLQVAHDVR